MLPTAVMCSEMRWKEGCTFAKASRGHHNEVKTAVVVCKIPLRDALDRNVRVAAAPGLMLCFRPVRPVLGHAGPQSVRFIAGGTRRPLRGCGDGAFFRAAWGVRSMSIGRRDSGATDVTRARTVTKGLTFPAPLVRVRHRPKGDFRCSAHRFTNPASPSRRCLCQNVKAMGRVPCTIAAGGSQNTVEPARDRLI